MYSKYSWLHSFLGPKIARVALRNAAVVVTGARGGAPRPLARGARAAVIRLQFRHPVTDVSYIVFKKIDVWEL